MPEKKYIDAVAILPMIPHINGETTMQCVERAIAHVPSADVVEVRHARWEINCDGYYPYCTNCAYEPPRVPGKDMRTLYCPNCGAKMDSATGTNVGDKNETVTNCHGLDGEGSRKTERERLIELLETVPADEAGNRNVGVIAEYLLAHGVLLPPCKAGDEVNGIVKALGSALKTGDEPIGKHWGCFLTTETVKNALDLINRQKAEIGRMTTLAELGSVRSNDYRAMRDKARKARAEAVKEFVERLCEGRVSNDPVVIAAKCLLKEVTEAADGKL